MSWFQFVKWQGKNVWLIKIKHQIKKHPKLVTKKDLTAEEEGQALRYETEIPFWIEIR